MQPAKACQKGSMSCQPGQPKASYLHKETTAEDGQTVKAAQSLQDLELQPFQEVFRLVPSLSPVTLGRREPAALEDQEPDKAEAEDVFGLQA